MLVRTLYAAAVSSVALPVLVLCLWAPGPVGSGRAPQARLGTDATPVDARRIELRCGVGRWTALEPLGEREHESVWTGSADCVADGPSLNGAAVTIDLLWEADSRRVTWQGATWRGADGPVPTQPVEAGAVPVPDKTGWRVRFGGVPGPDGGAGPAGPAYVMTARLELPLLAAEPPAEP
jgi:hypothetical protein